MMNARKALSVSDLTRKIRAAIEGGIGSLWVEGEVSNLKTQTSGHQYFSLKDAGAQIRCVFFRGDIVNSPVPLRDGMLVQVYGSVTVREDQGNYQIIVRNAQPRGMGELQARFEALKRKLKDEGLFDSARKRPIARFPKTIVLVTSPTGAAVRDMLNILSRRSPWVQVLIGPAAVQGVGAGEDIAKKIRWLGKASGKKLPKIDTMIVGRGGGSVEDLWSFNEEVVARAIYDCPIPVISAVGHEIDFTISDFVADLRAPTPSAAAELVAPDKAELLQQLNRTRARLGNDVHRAVEWWRHRVDQLAGRAAFREPTRILAERRQRLDDWQERLSGGVRVQLRGARDRMEYGRSHLEARRPSVMLGQRRDYLRSLDARLQNSARMQIQSAGELLSHARRRLAGLDPQLAIAQRKDRIINLEGRLTATARRRLAEFQHQATALGQMIRTLGPDSVFARGYSLTLDAEGHVVTSAAALRLDQRITTRLPDGLVESQVTSVEVKP